MRTVVQSPPYGRGLFNGEARRVAQFRAFPLIVDSNDLDIGFWWRGFFYNPRYPHLTVAQHYSLRIDEEVLILLVLNSVFDFIGKYRLVIFHELRGSIHRFPLFILKISQGIPGYIAEVHLVFRLDGFF
jgi:hypothetical protein